MRSDREDFEEGSVDPNNLSDDQTGIALFLDRIDPTIETGCSVMTGEEVVYSSIKERGMKDPWFLAGLIIICIGIFLCMAGAALVMKS